MCGRSIPDILETNKVVFRQVSAINKMESHLHKRYLTCKIYRQRENVSLLQNTILRLHVNDPRILAKLS